jgi:myo-inositol-1(or 4)-monophosphatase
VPRGLRIIPPVGEESLAATIEAAAHAAVDAAGAPPRGRLATSDEKANADRRADEAATEILVAAGLGVVSEESGSHHPDRDIVAVLDPLDGTSNWARGIPWYGPSICAGDRDGPRAAIVIDAPRRRTFRARRGGRAERDGQAIEVADGPSDRDLLVASSFGADPARCVWTRVLGATALELCLVAEGGLDGLVAAPADALRPWDHLAGLLLVAEAGGDVPHLDEHFRAALSGAPSPPVVVGATPAVTDRIRSLGAA